MQGDNDVEMADAPNIPAAPTRRPTDEEATAPPTLPYRGTGIGGLNERGEVTSMLPRGGGAPVIQTGSAGKKRPRDNHDDGQPSKKKVADDATAL
jgi:senataxin